MIKWRGLFAKQSAVPQNIKQNLHMTQQFHFRPRERETCPPQTTAHPVQQQLRGQQARSRATSKRFQDPFMAWEPPKLLDRKEKRCPVEHMVDTQLTGRCSPCSFFLYHHLDLCETPKPLSSSRKGQETPKSDTSQAELLEKAALLTERTGRTPLTARAWDWAHTSASEGSDQD
jgi:hypothetical protein